MPDSFAWVITVPNEPDEYAIADTELFEKMFALSENCVHALPKRNSTDSEVAALVGPMSN